MIIEKIDTDWSVSMYGATFARVSREGAGTFWSPVGSSWCGAILVFLPGNVLAGVTMVRNGLGNTKGYKLDGQS